jgi:hypothetical protein
MQTKFKMIILLLIVLTACKKEVAEDKSAFIGYWYGNIYEDGIVTLDVSADSYATYDVWLETDNHHQYEGIARANDKHFKIGRTKYFDIIEYPHVIDTTIERIMVPVHNGDRKLANWKMVLDGMKPGLFYADSKTAYYRADY